MPSSIYAGTAAQTLSRGLDFQINVLPVKQTILAKPSISRSLGYTVLFNEFYR